MTAKHAALLMLWTVGGMLVGGQLFWNKYQSAQHGWMILGFSIVTMLLGAAAVWLWWRIRA